MDSRLTTMLQVPDEEAGLVKWYEFIDGATRRFGRPDAVHSIVIQSSDPNVIAARLMKLGFINVAYAEDRGAPS